MPPPSPTRTGDDQLVTYPQATEKLHISLATLRRWISDGKLADIRHGHRVYIERREIAECAHRAREAGQSAVPAGLDRSTGVDGSLGAEPVSYGDGLAQRVAELVGGDGKVDVVVDFVGGDALTTSPSLVRDPTRHVSVVDAATVLEQGGRYVFVRPDAGQLAWLADLAGSGKLVVELQQTFPLEQAMAAQRLLEEGHVRGKLVLRP